MSATLRNNAEGGVHGEDVTVYNSGAISGDSFHYLIRGTGASITFSNTPARGTMAYECKIAATAAQAKMAWGNFPGGATTYARWALYLPASAAGKAVRCMSLDDNTSDCVTMEVTPTGYFRMWDTVGAVMFVSTTPVLYDTWQRFELQMISSATTGQAILRYFREVDSPHPLETLTSTATFNTRPNGLDVAYADFGILSGSSTNVTVYLDDLAVSSEPLTGPVDAHQVLPTALHATAENGSDTTAVTKLNSGDGSLHFFEEVMGDVTYSAEQTAHESLSYKMTPVSGSHARVEWRSLGTTSAALRLYIYFTGFPPAITEFAHLTTSAYATFTPLARFIMNTDGRVHVFDMAGTMWNSTSPLSLNTWYRLEMLATIGATAGTGTINAAYYTLDSTTPIGSFSTSSANLGTTPFGGLRVGKISSNAWATPMYVDDLAVQQNASAFIGPYTPPPSAPVAYLGIIPPEGWGVQL